jgi:hypothetical protein
MRERQRRPTRGRGISRKGASSRQNTSYGFSRKSTSDVERERASSGRFSGEKACMRVRLRPGVQAWKRSSPKGCWSASVAGRSILP